jgi:hypothetical protein
MRGRIRSPLIGIAATALIENPNLTLQQSAVAGYSKKQAGDLQRQNTVSKRKCCIMKAANEQNNSNDAKELSQGHMVEIERFLDTNDTI